MIRWKYVVPRLTLLALIAVVLWASADGLLKFTLVQTGQLALGSRVEIGSLDSSLSRGELEINDLVVANPDAPLRNLFEARRAVFDLDVGAALRKKCVVTDGLIEGLSFHTERGTSGILTTDPSRTDKPPSSSMTEQLGERGEAWVEDSLGKLQADVTDELQTVQLSKELQTRWPEAYRSLANRAQQIERQGRQIRDELKGISDDPLNNLAQVQPALAAIDGLRRDIVDVQSELKQVQQQMRQDRVALQAAKQHDVRYVRERLRVDALDGDSLTEYLLGPVWSERVETAIRWIRRSRAMMADQNAGRPETQEARGIDVPFPGFPATADLVIQQLRLSGAGTIDGDDYTFAGTLRDLTHQPRRHAQPAIIEIESQGAIRMVAHGILDRRRDESVDHFVVHLPSVSQNGQLLGDADRLAVYISPGQANIEADVVVRAQQLSGTIELRQEQLQLEPRLPERYTRYVSAESLSAAVRDVQHLKAVVTLSGPLEKPKFQIDSNLGPQLADGLNQAVQRELAQRQQQLVQVANREVEQQLEQLQNELSSEHGDILKSLDMGGSQLEQFKRQLTAGLSSPQDLIRRGKSLFK